MFKIHRSADKQFYFTLCSKNNKVLLTSEMYKRKENSKKGINAICTALGVKKPVIVDLSLTIKKK